MKNPAQIKLVMEKVAPHLQPTEKLAKALRDFRVSFMTKNAEHMAFFGGNLTGVQVVRFLPRDQDKFFNDVCDVDQYELEEELHKTDEINPSWKVSSNPFNHLCFWIIHLFITSSLPEKVKYAACMEAGLILYYRYLTSVLFNFFSYPVDPQLAQAVYAQMNMKFSIKKYGTWQKVLEHRVEKLIEPGSTHYETLINYSSDKDIIYMLNDSQGRVKDMMINIMSLFKEVYAKGSRIKSSSQLLEYEGDVILKDKTKGLQKYTQYLHSIVTDKNSFIKLELVDLVSKLVPTAPPKILEAALEWMSNNYMYATSDLVKNFIDKVMLHSFDYLEANRNVYKASSDLVKLVGKLKGAYTASRGSDPLLLEIRAMGEEIAANTKLTKNAVVIAATRTALLLYVVIRAFTMARYSRS